mmetsp:Transcript_29340/g.75645  ORF Transcript_29340/g.75645 Transcript_29340/m.75645 type:complete len:286 (+) Transcript_29340:1307-2164(+)
MELEACSLERVVQLGLAGRAHAVDGRLERLEGLRELALALDFRAKGRQPDDMRKVVRHRAVGKPSEELFHRVNARERYEGGGATTCQHLQVGRLDARRPKLAVVTEPDQGGTSSGRWEVYRGWLLIIQGLDGHHGGGNIVRQARRERLTVRLDRPHSGDEAHDIALQHIAWRARSVDWIELEVLRGEAILCHGARQIEKHDCSLERRTSDAWHVHGCVSTAVVRLVAESCCPLVEVVRQRVTAERIVQLRGGHRRLGAMLEDAEVRARDWVAAEIGGSLAARLEL